MRKLFIAVVCLLLCLSLSFGALAASNPFTDVPDNAWYAGYVTEAYENGWISGTSATRFSPKQEMTRAMVVTILWRMAGEPAPKDKPLLHYEDVNESAWYADAVAWADSYGILHGDDIPSFGSYYYHPEYRINRGGMVEIMRRYALYCDPNDSTLPGDMSVFADFDGIKSNFVKETFTWAVGAGLISGYERNGVLYLDSSNIVTRDQFVTIVCRYINQN